MQVQVQRALLLALMICLQHMQVTLLSWCCCHHALLRQPVQHKSHCAVKSAVLVR
jgi:hypothetical protein